MSGSNLLKNVVPTFLHAFADILWGFSDLLFPKSHKVQSWAFLQAVQLIVSIVLLMDLKSGRGQTVVAAPRLQFESAAVPAPVARFTSG